MAQTSHLLSESIASTHGDGSQPSDSHLNDVVSIASTHREESQPSDSRPDDVVSMLSTHGEELQPSDAHPNDAASIASIHAEETSLPQPHLNGAMLPDMEASLERSSLQEDACPGDLPIANLGKQVLWTPFYLRRAILTCFLIIFAILIALLEMLNWLSRRNQGLATTDSSKHYLWTYGPTAGKSLLNILQPHS